MWFRHSLFWINPIFCVIKMSNNNWRTINSLHLLRVWRQWATCNRKLFSKTSAENQAWPSSSSLSGKLFSWSHAWPCNQDGLIKLFAGNCPTKTNPIYQTNTEIIKKMFKFKQLWNNSSFNFPRWRIFLQKFNIKSTLFWRQFVIDSFGTVQTHIINTITVAGEVDPRLILLSLQLCSQYIPGVKTIVSTVQLSISCLDPLTTQSWVLTTVLTIH